MVMGKPSTKQTNTDVEDNAKEDGLDALGIPKSINCLKPASNT